MEDADFLTRRDAWCCDSHRLVETLAAAFIPECALTIDGERMAIRNPQRDSASPTYSRAKSAIQYPSPRSTRFTNAPPDLNARI